MNYDDEIRHAGHALGNSYWPATGGSNMRKYDNIKTIKYDVAVPQLLAHLLREMVQIRDGVRPAVALHGTPPERWEDEEFIYLEADLPGEPGPDIDICFHSGRAFIRMERSPAGPMSPP